MVWKLCGIYSPSFGKSTCRLNFSSPSDALIIHHGWANTFARHSLGAAAKNASSVCVKPLPASWNYILHNIYAFSGGSPASNTTWKHSAALALIFNRAHYHIELWCCSLMALRPIISTLRMQINLRNSISRTSLPDQCIFHPGGGKIFWIAHHVFTFYVIWSKLKY